MLLRSACFSATTDSSGVTRMSRETLNTELATCSYRRTMRHAVPNLASGIVFTVIRYEPDGSLLTLQSINYLFNYTFWRVLRL